MMKTNYEKKALVMIFVLHAGMFFFLQTKSTYWGNGNLVSFSEDLIRPKRMTAFVNCTSIQFVSTQNMAHLKSFCTFKRKHPWKWSSWERGKRRGGGISGRYFLPRHELLRSSRGNFSASTFNSFQTWNIAGDDVKLPEELEALLPRRGPICVPIIICLFVRHHFFFFSKYFPPFFSVLLFLHGPNIFLHQIIFLLLLSVLLFLN